MGQREQLIELVKIVPDNRVGEIMDFINFICSRFDETGDLLRASEGTLDFWDNPEDEVWDNV